MTIEAGCGQGMPAGDPPCLTLSFRSGPDGVFAMKGLPAGTCRLVAPRKLTGHRGLPAAHVTYENQVFDVTPDTQTKVTVPCKVRIR